MSSDDTAVPEVAPLVSSITTAQLPEGVADDTKNAFWQMRRISSKPRWRA
jgi:hypothetical protein